MSTTAIKHKEEGNAAFKSGDFNSSVTHYTAAIAADATDVTFSLNRAAAYLKLSKNEDAERDCSTVLQLQPTNVKALYRRAQARIALGKHSDAREDLETASKIEPNNIPVLAELAKVVILIVHPTLSASQSGSPPAEPLPRLIQTKIDNLTKQLTDFETSQNSYRRNSNRLVEEDEDEDEDEDKAQKALKKTFLTVLYNTCSLVREAELWGSPHLSQVVEAAQQLQNRGVSYAYGDSKLYGFVPSFAHNPKFDQPLIRDLSATALQPPRGMLDMLGFFGVRGGGGMEMSRLDPWREDMKRHPKSSRLARFRVGLPTLTPTQANPLAMSVYDARCEVSSDSIFTPVLLEISQGNSCMAISGMGGFKNRSPALSYYLLDDANDSVTGLPHQRSIEIGLADIARRMAVDESRKLIFVGDKDRIKSYAWGALNGEIYEEALPTHTMASSSHNGPITILPNGTVIRAGRGCAGIWNIAELPTHGRKGKKRIGERLNSSSIDSWRDDPECIELSAGTPQTSHMFFADYPTLHPGTWTALTHTPTTMISSTSPLGTQDYGCISLDLAYEGKTSARYLGHGGGIDGISTSAGDPNVFLTTCSDGLARLFDVRRPLPVLTFDACRQEEFCPAGVLAHPDGIPTVFTGTGKFEQIKMWDVRARASVYELATGNNRVESLAWDSKRTGLYAITECAYMDRLGYRHGYRAGYMPDRPRSNRPFDENEDEEEEEDDGDYERCWPDPAFHKEHFFGYPFDAGDHRVYRYAFKENPNTTILPIYGDATVNEFADF